MLSLHTKISIVDNMENIINIVDTIVRGDIIYGQPSKASVSDKIEFVQRDARFAIILAIKGTLRVKLYMELRLEE